MKKLLLVLFIAFAGCSSDDPSPKAYTSYEGKWKFSQNDVSGQFEVEKNPSNKLVVTSGTFTLNGHTYTIDYQNEIVPGMGITLLNEGGSNISFIDPTYSEDFKKIDIGAYFYTYEGNYVEVNEPIEIIR